MYLGKNRSHFIFPLETVNKSGFSRAKMRSVTIMGNCATDIRNHLKSFGAGFADSTLKTEARLLFARAGKLHVSTWYCTNVFIFEKIWSTGNDTHCMVSKSMRTFLYYIMYRAFPTKLVANNFS